MLRGCFVHKLFIWDLGSWPLYRGDLYSGVAVKRGSTVVTKFIQPLHFYVTSRIVNPSSMIGACKPDALWWENSIQGSAVEPLLTATPE